MVYFNKIDIDNANVDKIWLRGQASIYKPDGTKLVGVIKKFKEPLDPPLDKLPILRCVIIDASINPKEGIQLGKYITDDCWIELRKHSSENKLFGKADVSHVLRGESISLELMERMIENVLEQKMKPMVICNEL